MSISDGSILFLDNINDSEETVNIDKWGYVTSSGPTEVLVVGTYNLNPRVKIFIHLVVTE